MIDTILIVDDNDRYAENLKKFFENLGFQTDRAVTAGEGYKKIQEKEYSTVISDITMESQLSGLFFVRKLFKSGYKGNIIIATTGFDFPGVMFIGQFLLPWYCGIGWMIPKVPLKRGEVVFVPCYPKRKIDFIRHIRHL